MIKLDRRQFIQASTAAVLGEAARRTGPPGRPITDADSSETVHIERKNYTWEWSPADDRFRLRDKRGLVMASGPLQPAVLVQPGEDKQARKCLSGKATAHAVKGASVTITYEGVNGGSGLSLNWRFEDEALWLDPVVYESKSSENVVALHYFAQGSGGTPQPALRHFYLIVPGICESPSVSPIVTADLGLNLTSWLGRGSSPAPGLLQQWGLPAHFFCGFDRNQGGAVKSSLVEGLSDAFCCGLAELPNGDLFLETNRGRHSLIVSYRSDLWGHLQGPGSLTLGMKLCWVVGANYHEAIRAYYRELLRAGVVQKKTNSARKTAVALSPQFNTWGAEVAIGKEGSKLDEPTLRSFYKQLQESGMKARMFVIDDKWEGKYGNLEHSAERFPHFEEFRAQVRADGRHFGLWAAFMRCQDPADLGLNISHMLHRADGKPVTSGSGSNKYYLLDFTQPEVAKVLRARAQRFVERYQPDLVKFDFGYELPPLSEAAPQDMNWAGERLMLKGLEVVVHGMREANPDLVVMYYCLSPLFTDYFDLHSPDDLFMAAGEYDFEANRRFFFSGLLGELGLPTYGSGGYDWEAMPEIWFDSALMGTLGSLNSFVGDEWGSLPTPERIAKYNGLSRVLRPSPYFTIEPVGAAYIGATRGAHSPSWARYENGELVALALRTRGLDGRDGPCRYRDIASTSASVVLASQTSDGLAKSKHLAIVPYGQGELILRCGAGEGTEARIQECYWGGSSRESRIKVQEKGLRLPLRERDEKGLPVEWIEVRIEPA